MANPNTPQGWLWSQGWYSARNKVLNATEEIEVEQKICSLCGRLLGEVFYAGYTHINIRLLAITCDKFDCVRWLKVKKKITKIK